MEQKNMMEQKLAQMVAGRPLDMEDTFNFDCMGCGRCCYGHDDILLSGYDLFRMSRYLGIPIEDAIDKYCIVTAGGSSRLPVVTLAQKENRACSLLNGTKCLVHQAKPDTCAIYPLGRMADSHNKNVQYILQDKSALPPGCNHTYKKHTVKEWLSGFNIDENDPNILAWYEAIFAILDIPFMETYRERFNSFTENTCRAIVGVLMNALYLQFDMNKTYGEQLKNNVNILERIFDKLYSAYTSASS